MSRTVDVKTLTIGLLLGVCVMAARGHGDAEERPAPLPYPRYQISASNRGELPYGQRVFVLDNLTNEVTSYQQANVRGTKWVRDSAFRIED